jgi:hypothetical protein
MAFQLIASHIQHELQEEADRRRFERLVRRGAPAARIDRLRAAAGRRLIDLGQALGGETLRRGRSGSLPAGRLTT